MCKRLRSFHSTPNTDLNDDKSADKRIKLLILVIFTISLVFNIFFVVLIYKLCPNWWEKCLLGYVLFVSFFLFVWARIIYKEDDY